MEGTKDSDFNNRVGDNEKVVIRNVYFDMISAMVHNLDNRYHISILPVRSGMVVMVW